MRTRASNSGWVSSTRPLCAAACQAVRSRTGDGGRRAPRGSCRCGRSIKPLFRSEAARLVPLFRRHPFLGDAEGPDMAFRVAGAIGAVAVELSLGLLQDLRARLARVLAMS